MSKERKQLLKSSAAFGIATMLSRILGLVRVVCSAAILGGGARASAWFYVFMIPNLFRRLLGEGALGSALVPIVSYTREQEGSEQARIKLAGIVNVLGVVLALLCILIAGGSLIARNFVADEQWLLILSVLPVIIPYAFFICIVGALTSVLNSLGRFFWPAMGALLLNVVLISVYLFVCPLWNDDLSILYSLSGGVLCAGVLQLALTIYLLAREDMLPKFSSDSKQTKRDALKELFKLMVPALLGSGALQISMFIDKNLAIWIGDRALPALTYSDRIVYLPVGIIAVAFGSAALSQMSRAAAKGDDSVLLTTLESGLRYMAVMCIPVTAYIFIFRDSIIRLLFFHGSFDAVAFEETSFAMAFFCLGIPAFCSLKVVTAAFHSRKDMKTPLKISLWAIGVNLVLNLILMWPLRQGGLALATVVSSMLNNFLLLRIIKSQYSDFDSRLLVKTGVKSVLSAVVAGAGAYGCGYAVTMLNMTEGLICNGIFTASTGIVFCIGYALLMMMFKSEEITEVVSVVARRLKVR